MSKPTETNLFIVSSLRPIHRLLLKGFADYASLGKRIIREVEVAHAFRQIERVRELSSILANIPIREYQLLGQYYLVWSQCREGIYLTDELDSIFERTQLYKTIVLTSRGTFESYKGNNDAALYFYKEALRTSPNVSEYIELSRAIAVMKAQEGFRHAAIRDLEKLLPIIKHAEPLAYYQLLNSYAVELNEVGRLQEAKNISALVCATPLAPYRSEWLETYSEVNQKLHKSRSTVHVVLPKREPKKRVKKAKILPFPQRKPDSFMRASYGPPTRAEIHEAIDRGKGLDPKQIHALLLKVVLQDRVTDDEIMHIVEVYYDAMVYGLD